MSHLLSISTDLLSRDGWLDGQGIRGSQRNDLVQSGQNVIDAVVQRLDFVDDAVGTGRNDAEVLVGKGRLDEGMECVCVRMCLRLTGKIAESGLSLMNVP